jgi:hypothetical protein
MSNRARLDRRIGVGPGIGDDHAERPRVLAVGVRGRLV